jgi:biopolymer transport protein ExbB
MLTQEELIKWLKLGGVTLAAILFCSILAVAVTIERLWIQRVFIGHLRRLQKALQKALRGSRASLELAREAISDKTPSPIAEVFSSGLAAAERGDAHKIEAAVDRARQRAGLYLKRWMWVLGTIGATAPFIGLFGTVYGIMKAMGKIGETGQTGFTIVAEGISEALITTAVGIAVAIEAVILFNALQSRLGSLTLELKLCAEEFVEDLLSFGEEGRQSGGAAGRQSENGGRRTEGGGRRTEGGGRRAEGGSGESEVGSRASTGDTPSLSKGSAFSKSPEPAEGRKSEDEGKSPEPVEGRKREGSDEDSDERSEPETNERARPTHEIKRGNKRNKG